MLTNCDNYYIPKTVYYFNEALNEHTEQFDVVIFNMVHSHSSKKFLSYSPLSVEFRRNCIDVGAAFVKKEIAEMVGFRDKGFSGDATYFEDISKLKNHKIAICKINRILLVHN